MPEANDRPVIGLTTYGRDSANRFDCPGEYVDAVRRAGAVAVLLPPGEADCLAVASRLDGLVLTGGGDINPERYGEERHATVYSVDDERDAAEFALARYVLETGLPTLAICRGMQLLNVLLGGTLHQHVPDALGESVIHRVPPRDATRHRVTLREGSRIAGLCAALDFDCASWHHQGLATVASGLEVTGWAPDRLVESVEMPAHPWLIGVQWHPELTAAGDPVQQRLFDGLRAAALAHRARD